MNVVDGRPDIAATAGQSRVDRPGVCYVFTSLGEGTTLAVDAEALFTGENPGALDGGSLAALGDSDGDGFDDLLVGAPQSLEGGEPWGRVYLVGGFDSGAR